MARLYPLAIFLSFLLTISPSLSTNSEGNALHALRSRLSDPTNVLQSWDPTLVNPCTWFHVTCDSSNHVTRLYFLGPLSLSLSLSLLLVSFYICRYVAILFMIMLFYFQLFFFFNFRDLGNSNISGTLGPELGELRHLKYLELYRNDIGGKIPKELGNLKNLVSMDMYGNRFEGEIPKSFAKLKSLRFLRLNNNKLSGSIPRELTTLKDLKVFDVSNNDLCGTIPVDGPFTSFPMESFENNKLNGPELKGLVPYDFGC
ncbi:hypothetical protein H0E87_001255 [Populus deltoides]|uniref:Leucine-rich repeat-containing N-terminal plant-type domain-containing protein n=1 Tax=Populus deltoides TaxID=3696 RepID=A0A8T2ZQY6_POPDE|nr:hypothetical protein H0E87_001255 [Populus deltoides]